MGNTSVPALPPISGVSDPQVRVFLQALSNAWDQRSGNISQEDDERFITKGEFTALASNVLSDALGGAVAGGPIKQSANGAGGTNTAITDAINGMSDWIKQGILYQLLGTEVVPTDIGYLQQRLDTLFGDAKTLIFSEIKKREDADSASLEMIDAVGVKVDTANAAIVVEKDLRATKDSALAQAVNTMWAAIGGNEAVIQDGQLAAVTPASVVATKWSQVQAAAIDPNTGLSTSAILRQDFNTEVSKIDGKLNSLYTLRAQLTQNGRTVVGGFGLAATAGAGSGGGPLIDFGVRADRFWIASPGSTAEELATMGDKSIPFYVLSTPQYVNGVLQNPGVYIKSANIAKASIENAQMTGPIYSDNFATGSSGWIIRRDGTAEFWQASIRGDLYSANYVQGYVGWRISSTGLYPDGYGGTVMAEFNGIAISRPQRVAGSTFYPSAPNTFTYSGGSGAKDGAGTPAGWAPAELVFYLDTGFDDDKSTVDVTRPAFVGKGICKTAYMTYSSDPGGAKVYDIPVEATAMTAVDHYKVGSSVATPGGNIILKFVVPVPRNLDSRITSVRIDSIEWALMRVT